MLLHIMRLPSFVLWVDRSDPQYGTTHTAVVAQKPKESSQGEQYQSSPLYHLHPYTINETVVLHTRSNIVTPPYKDIPFLDVLYIPVWREISEGCVLVFVSPTQ